MELPRNFAARHAKQWTSWLRESLQSHARVALFTEIFESFGDRSDFKDSIRRVLRMNGPFQRLTSQAIAKIMKRPRKGIKNFSIWERKQIYHRFVNGLSKAQEGWRGLYLPLSISPSPFVSLAIKIWFKFPITPDSDPLPQRSSLPVRVETRKESIWMRTATSNRIRERFAFKSKSFRRENVFQLLASRRSSPAVDEKSDSPAIVGNLSKCLRRQWSDSRNLSFFVLGCWKGFSGSRAEIDENIHKMFQFTLRRNCDCDCCVYLFTFYAIYRTQSRIRHGRRPGTLPAAKAP